MKYQKDIDEFMQVVKERVTGNYSQVWFGLYNGLRDIIPQEDKAYLIAQWEAHQTELAISNWRDRFMEATIDEASYAKAYVVGAYGATTGRTTTATAVGIQQQQAYAQQMQQVMQQKQKEALQAAQDTLANNLYGQQYGQTANSLNNSNNIWDVPGVKG